MEDRIFSEQVARIRIEKGISVEEISEKLDLKENSYLRNEEMIGFTAEELVAVAKILGVKMSTLLHGELEESPFGNEKEIIETPAAVFREDANAYFKKINEGRSADGEILFFKK